MSTVISRFQKWIEVPIVRFVTVIMIFGLVGVSLLIADLVSQDLFSFVVIFVSAFVAFLTIWILVLHDDLQFRRHNYSIISRNYKSAWHKELMLETRILGGISIRIETYSQDFPGEVLFRKELFFSEEEVEDYWSEYPQSFTLVRARTDDPKRVLGEISFTLAPGQHARAELLPRSRYQHNISLGHKYTHYQDSIAVNISDLAIAEVFRKPEIQIA